jgi:hypothetical protein
MEVTPTLLMAVLRLVTIFLARMMNSVSPKARAGTPGYKRRWIDFQEYLGARRSCIEFLYDRFNSNAFWPIEPQAGPAFNIQHRDGMWWPYSAPPFQQSVF